MYRIIRTIYISILLLRSKNLCLRLIFILWVIYRLLLCVKRKLYRFSLRRIRDWKAIAINLRDQFLSCVFDRRFLFYWHFRGIYKRRDFCVLSDRICNRLILFYFISMLSRLSNLNLLIILLSSILLHTNNNKCDNETNKDKSTHRHSYYSPDTNWNCTLLVILIRSRRIIIARVKAIVLIRGLIWRVTCRWIFIVTWRWLVSWRITDIFWSVVDIWQNIIIYSWRIRSLWKSCGFVSVSRRGIWGFSVCILWWSVVIINYIVSVAIRWICLPVYSYARVALA